MPQRFLRPGITNSARYNSVSRPAQNLFCPRVMTLVDDFGRCDGRASVIWGQCFPVWNELHPDEQVDLAETSRLLQELAAAGLVDIYEADGKLVLQINQWRERIRPGTKEKWPANPNPQQPAEIRSNFLPPSPSPSPSPSPAPAPNAESPGTPGDAGRLPGDGGQTTSEQIESTEEQSLPVVEPPEIPSLDDALAFALSLTKPPRTDAEHVVAAWLLSFTSEPKPDWRRSLSKKLLDGKRRSQAISTE